MLEIGVQCTFCGFRDFLPFSCPGCEGQYCSEHREKHSHNCSNQFKSGTGKSVRTPPKIKMSAPLATIPQTTTAAAVPSLRSAPQKMPLPAPATAVKQARGGQRLGGSTAASTPASSNLSASGQSALARLKSIYSGRKTRVQERHIGKPTVSSKADIMREHVEASRTHNSVNVPGNESIGVGDRVYVLLRRPASKYKNPLTQREETRPEKVIDTFFSSKQRIGQVTDLASTLLGISVVGLTIEGADLDPALPLSAVPPGKVLDALPA